VSCAASGLRYSCNGTICRPHLQQALFEYAVSIGDPRDRAQLKGEIARFLHKYKNTGAASPLCACPYPAAADGPVAGWG
jgi:hypothetical protein